jgi:hypothetical protein
VIIVLILTILLAWPSGPIPATALSAPEALHVLSAAEPEVRWDAKSEIHGDFAGDGFADRGFLGHAKGRVFVGLVRASTRKAEVLDFAVSRGVQEAICSEPAKLRAENLDYDPQAEGQDLEGFQRSRHAKGMVLSDGECDPIHLYWNHKSGHLAWWRQ